MAKKNPIQKITEKAKTEKPNEARELLEEIAKAEKIKKNWREQFRIDLSYAFRDGSQKPPEIADTEWVTINKFYTNLKAELPSLYSTDPYFFIKLARTYTVDPMKIALYEQKAKIRSAMLNYLKREMGWKPTIRLSVEDAFFQFGVTKSIFHADETENPKRGEPVYHDDGETPQMNDEGYPILQPDTIPVNQAYKMTRVHPNDIGWDADAGVLPDTWTFVYEIVRMKLKDAKKDKRYPKSIREDFRATELSETEAEKARQARKNRGSVAGKDPEPDVVVLYEVYWLKEPKWCVVSPGSNDFVIKPETTPDGIEKHPYSFLFLGLSRDDSPYPIPPVSQWIDAQREYNDIRSKFKTHRRRFNRKYEMYDAAFDDPDSTATKLEHGEDGTILRKSQPIPGVTPISDAPLDQNLLQEYRMVRSDFEELSSGANQLGAGAGVDSATEAGIIEKRVVIREGDNLSLVMDFVIDIGRKIDQLVQTHIDRDQAVSVVGPEGEYWELVKEDDYEKVEGEYEYTVNVGSTIPQLPEIERAQFMQLLGLLAQAPHLATVRPLLKKAFEMHRIDDETLITALHEMGKQMMGMQTQQMGSMPGIPDMMTKTASILGGQSGGMNNIRGGNV